MTFALFYLWVVLYVFAYPNVKKQYSLIFNKLASLTLCFDPLIKNKKVWNSDSSYNMDEPLKLYDKFDKPDTAWYYVYFDLYAVVKILKFIGIYSSQRFKGTYAAKL